MSHDSSDKYVLTFKWIVSNRWNTQLLDVVSCKLFRNYVPAWHDLSMWVDNRSEKRRTTEHRWLNNYIITIYPMLRKWRKCGSASGRDVFKTFSESLSPFILLSSGTKCAKREQTFSLEKKVQGGHAQAKTGKPWPVETAHQRRGSSSPSPCTRKEKMKKREGGWEDRTATLQEYGNRNHWSNFAVS